MCPRKYMKSHLKHLNLTALDAVQMMSVTWSFLLTTSLFSMCCNHINISSSTNKHKTDSIFNFNTPGFSVSKRTNFFCQKLCLSSHFYLYSLTLSQYTLFQQCLNDFSRFSCLSKKWFHIFKPDAFMLIDIHNNWHLL